MKVNGKKYQCEKCGEWVKSTYPVDEDDFIPYMNDSLTKLHVGSFARKVCSNCCRGAKVIYWDVEGNKVNLYA